jgi:hypothetical protein
LRKALKTGLDKEFCKMRNTIENKLEDESNPLNEIVADINTTGYKARLLSTPYAILISIRDKQIGCLYVDGEDWSISSDKKRYDLRLKSLAETIAKQYNANVTLVKGDRNDL